MKESAQKRNSKKGNTHVDIRLGLTNEYKLKVNMSSEYYPLYISFCGITHPTPEYYIKRFPIQTYILEYVVSGKGYLIVNGEKFTVQAGDSYLLKPGENCEYFADKNDPFEKMWVNFTSKLFREIISAYKLQKTVYHGTDLKELFTRLIERAESPNDSREFCIDISEILFPMLMHLARNVNEANHSTPLAEQIYNRLFYAVTKPFNLNELCDEFFVSKTEIIRQFKKSYGVTPYQFLLDRKMQFAKNMLENDGLSVKEVSEALGFSSPYHFSNYFKKRFGISPSEHRATSHQ